MGVPRSGTRCSPRDRISRWSSCPWPPTPRRWRARSSARGCRPSSRRRSAPAGGPRASRTCPRASGPEGSTEPAAADPRVGRTRAGPGPGAGARCDRRGAAREPRAAARVDRGFRILGGLAFGVVLGTVYVLIAATTGASLAFLIARYAARVAVERWMAPYPALGRIDRAVARHGFRIVMITRLI